MGLHRPHTSLMIWVVRAGVAQRRRNRRSSSRQPAGARGRFRRLRGLRARFLLQVGEDDDGEALGHLGSAPRRRWLRLLATMNGGALGWRWKRAREEEEEALEGGNGLTASPGASRCEKRPRGGLEAPRRRRVTPGWLGGIPPSSLGARGEEEDAPAPGGPGGLAGPAPPGRQVRFSFYFCLIFPFFFCNLFWL